MQEYLENKIREKDAPVYGVNTGFGRCTIPIYQMAILKACKKTW
jgi:histidine ammonia-lyase